MKVKIIIWCLSISSHVSTKLILNLSLKKKKAFVCMTINADYAASSNDHVAIKFFFKCVMYFKQ